MSSKAIEKLQNREPLGSWDFINLLEKLEVAALQQTVSSNEVGNPPETTNMWRTLAQDIQHALDTTLKINELPGLDGPS